MWLWVQEKKSHIVSDKDKKVTAYHEAGHAIVSYFLPTQDPVHQISIIQRGMAAGYTMYLPVDEKGHTSKNSAFRADMLLARRQSSRAADAG